MIATNRSYWQVVREIMADFPQTLESTSYGTPAYKVNKKLLLRLKEDDWPRKNCWVNTHTVFKPTRLYHSCDNKAE